MEESRGPKVSGTRIYIGKMPQEATEDDVRKHFAQNNANQIKEVKLKGKYGFVEFNNDTDAHEAVPRLHGKPFLSTPELVVQFAKGDKAPDFNPRDNPRAGPMKTTNFGMVVSGLPPGTSWQDLKDHARRGNPNVKYTHAPFGGEEGTGVVYFETSRDLTEAIKKLDRSYFGNTDYIIECVIKVPRERSYSPRRQNTGYRDRSRSPTYRNREYQDRDDYRANEGGRYNDQRFEDREGRPRHSDNRGRYQEGGRFEDRPPRRDDYADAPRDNGRYHNRQGSGPAPPRNDKPLRYPDDRW